MKNIAIITGATGGFGREFIKLLLKKDNVDEIWAIARNNDKFAELLTLITSYDIVDGIYIIPKCSKSYKRVSNIQFLQKMMEFIDILKSINMEVIVGNSDIESLLYIIRRYL